MVGKRLQHNSLKTNATFFCPLYFPGKIAPRISLLQIVMVWIKAAFIELITRLHNMHLLVSCLILNNVNAVDFFFHESILFYRYFLLGCFFFHAYALMF